MISFLRGIIAEKNSGEVTVDVAGIGYLVNTSLNTVDSVGTIGDNVTLRTVMHVREDCVALYGFATKEELNLFEKLISVSGVGPKAALGILSYISPAEFAVSVLNDDIKKLTKISGIGPKSAQRIIFELKDKMRKDYKNLNIEKNSSNEIPENAAALSKCEDIIIALCALGFTAAEARNAVSTVNDDGLSEEELLRQALRRLSKP